MRKNQNEAPTYFVLALIVLGGGLWLTINGATVPGVLALVAGLGAAVYAWTQYRATPRRDDAEAPHTQHVP